MGLTDQEPGSLFAFRGGICTAISAEEGQRSLLFMDHLMGCLCHEEDVASRRHKAVKKVMKN